MEQINSFESAEAYLNSLINYERSPNFSYAESLKLDRVYELLATLDNPHTGLPTMHIAGTKGKGSTATYLDALLRAHGHLTGLYTSPHLVTFRERIRVDGKLVAKGAFAHWISEMQSEIEHRRDEQPDDPYSFFDVLTALALSVFREEKIHFAVMEVGMGGRLDATNVVEPGVAIITPIGLEHTRHLGSTLEEIAAEKAGIIKGGSHVVLSEQASDKAMGVLKEKCRAADVHPWVVGEEILVESRTPFEFDLRVNGQQFDRLQIPAWGRHQQINSSCAIAAMLAAGLDVDDEIARSTLMSITLPGRVEQINSDPDVIVDVAHTGESVAHMVEAVSYLYPDRKWTLVFGCGNDKNADLMVERMANHVSRVILPQTDSPRAMPAVELEPLFDKRNIDISTTVSVETAIELAQRVSSPEALIVICGSFIVVGAAMEYYGNEV